MFMNTDLVTNDYDGYQWDEYLDHASSHLNTYINILEIALEFSSIL
jgi:hypothetical protein